MHPRENNNIETPNTGLCVTSTDITNAETVIKTVEQKIKYTAKGGSAILKLSCLVNYLNVFCKMIFPTHNRARYGHNYICIAGEDIDFIFFHMLPSRIKANFDKESR